MRTLFFICLSSLFLLLPIYLLSINHAKLNRIYGKVRGKKYGEILGKLSGWLFFLFLTGLWLSPQPRFTLLSIPEYLVVDIYFINIDVFSLFFSFIVIITACFIGVKGVLDLSLKISETHRPEVIISKGIYSKIRHPQYLAAFLAHIGFSILFSLLYSISVTPLIMLYLYILSKIEEKELIKEFGNDYRNYMKKVNMFLPLLKK